MENLSQLADDLFELVIDIDPARTSWDRISDGLHLRASQLAHQSEQLKGQISGAQIEAPHAQALQTHLTSTSDRLRELSEALGDKTGAQRWRTLYTALAKGYDDIVRSATAARLSDLGRFRRLSPANHSRSLFHIASGVIGALCYHYLLDRTGAAIVMALFVVTFSSMELVRHKSTWANDAMMRVFRPIARAREYYQVNSSTYYVWGMLLSVLLFSREAVEAGCLVLAFGDPMASYLGRRFGKVKLFRDKSLVGSLVFFGASFAAVLSFQLFAYPQVPIEQRLLLSALAAGTGALAELFAIKLDDNFTVPVATALAVTLAF